MTPEQDELVRKMRREAEEIAAAAMAPMPPADYYPAYRRTLAAAQRDIPAAFSMGVFVGVMLGIPIGCAVALWWSQ